VDDQSDAHSLQGEITDYIIWTWRIVEASKILKQACDGLVSFCFSFALIEARVHNSSRACKIVRHTRELQIGG
jgi:hypothetical protein